MFARFNLHRTHFLVSVFPLCSRVANACAHQQSLLEDATLVAACGWVVADARARTHERERREFVADGTWSALYAHYVTSKEVRVV